VGSFDLQKKKVKKTKATKTKSISMNE
jgi:hypothetical protein